MRLAGKCFFQGGQNQRASAPRQTGQDDDPTAGLDFRFELRKLAAFKQASEYISVACLRRQVDGQSRTVQSTKIVAHALMRRIRQFRLILLNRWLFIQCLDRHQRISQRLRKFTLKQLRLALRA